MNEKEILAEYLPVEAVELVYHWIVRYKIHLKITRNRRTRLGDYRPPGTKPYHRISVNHNLNPYAFLITFVHELAHLKTFKKYGHNRQPHGKEWKSCYRQLMEEVMNNKIFPTELAVAVQNHLQKVRASSSADIELTRALGRYDEQRETHVEDLKEGSLFLFHTHRKFEVLSKARTRYKCRELATNKVYLFHALTPVEPVEKT
jgi:SprT protein